MRVPIQEVEKAIIKNLKCPKCGGNVLRDGDEIACLACGWAGGEFITQGMSRGSGRKREGIYTKCLDCGADIYVRPHRLENDEDGKEYRCRSCASRKAAKEPRPRTTSKESGPSLPAKMGRPRTGLDAKCADCGIDLYIARNRIKDNKVYRCLPCINKGVADRKITKPESADGKLTDKDLPPITKQQFETVLKKVSTPIKKKEGSWVKITSELIADWEAKAKEIREQMAGVLAAVEELKGRFGELEDEAMSWEFDVESGLRLVKAYQKKYPNNEVNVTE